jgi:hypothetical protein
VHPAARPVVRGFPDGRAGHGPENECGKSANTFG